jgi:sortase (surface protein transpeptidase)
VGALATRSNLLRGGALLAFVLGIALLVIGFSCRGSDAPPGSGELKPFDVPISPTIAATSEILTTPTPTPPPFQGAVAKMSLPRLGIDYPIEPIGILPNNELDTPKDALGKIGWYNIYAKPGFGSNAVFSAHVNYYSGDGFKPGPFANLTKVEPGDEIVVEMANGQQYTYKVFKKQRYPVDTIPMGDLIWPKKPDDQEWITLITCGGNAVNVNAQGIGEFDSRDVVVALRVR